MFILYFAIALFASTIGAISGIGGGIIIKPVMDALGTLSTETISFMSGCTVLSMTVSSFIRGRKRKTKIDIKTSLWLAIGAAVGGIIGKSLFSYVPGNVALIQSAILFVINVGVFIYIRKRDNIKTFDIENQALCILIGFSLGLVSAFLGIGGGPINIAVLYYFFSMTPKVTARNSLFIILFSQSTSLITTFATRTVPTFEPLSLIVMCIGGVAGAIIGAAFATKMNDEKTENFFSVVLVGLIALNLYNLVMALL